MQFKEMILPIEAEKIIAESFGEALGDNILDPLGNLHDTLCDTLPISEAAGRILLEPICADREQPPFDRVAMDGIAIQYASFERGLRRFQIQEMQKAGEPQKILIGENSCIEVMTGSVLPMGCNCIIPVESLEIENGFAKVIEEVKVDEHSKEKKHPKISPPGPFKNVHRRGSDCKQGEVIVPTGVTLISPHIGAAASFGYKTLKVLPMPRIALIATGDELVDADVILAAYQIRRSNSFALEAALRKNGFGKISTFPVRDEKYALMEGLKKVLSENEIVIVTGGVSMGKTDYVPEILAILGIEPRFHRIRHRPGKPFWFGVGKTSLGKPLPVFALPGNPASVLVCLYRYVLPALLKFYSGKKNMPRKIAVEKDIPALPNQTNFIPVIVHGFRENKSEEVESKFTAETILHQGSGDFSGWAKSEGFIEIPAGADLKAGMLVDYWGWD